MSVRVLLVEDDPGISDVVDYLLAAEGYSVRRAADGSAGWRLCQEFDPDLVILDLGLPGIPGFDLLRCIRGRREDQPVIILTARGEPDTRVRGLTAGADDYLVKPFVNAELVARVRNLLRRCPPRSQPLCWGMLRLDAERFLVTAGETEIRLPRNECRLLAALLRHPSRVFSREQLMAEMYGSESEFTDRAVDQVVRRLRARLRPALGGLDPIVSNYGVGYRLAEPP